MREEGQAHEARQAALNSWKNRLGAESILVMKMFCHAYGLRLESGFPLPGIEPEREPPAYLPALTLSLCAGTPAHPWGSGELVWCGRLGDGRELAVERGAGAEVLFSYGDLAVFRLDAMMERLDCAPHVEGLDWQRTLIGKVIPAVAVMRGYEGLHGVVLDSPEGVVAIMAPGGTGKSTLALELMRRGWPLFADDQLTLERVGDSIRAHHGTAHMNVSEQTPISIDADELVSELARLGGERWVTAKRTSEELRGVRLLCLLERAPGLTLGSERLESNPLALVPYMLGVPLDTERERARFALFCDLTESTSMVRITAEPAATPAQLANLLEQALTVTAQATAASAR